ncbi:MAG: DedA family protein [Gemmatimonadota bacterium]|nr:DedA family protein [Gemmatimonadota bacterium]MDE3127387.1 DedA family protein [Gemmatimonadota bacterium]MDE3173485.1 DedA family protein [Gemmatimonadota bacterium]MDE3217417.1 DedA family protein [Gemmatimonadota bacterium]
MAVSPLLDWVLALPLGWLYLFCAAIAGAENFFPPVPADSVIAFGSFLAARGHGSALVTLGAVLVGNVGTAMITYALGRRYGAAPLERRLLGERAPEVEARLESYYGRFGLAAIFLGRFIPGVRALVPPFAGALRVPALTALLLMGSASVLWYGTVSYVGFRLGSNWPHVVSVLSRNGAIVSGAAAVVAGVLFAVWLARRRRR